MLYNLFTSMILNDLSCGTVNDFQVIKKKCDECRTLGTDDAASTKRLRGVWRQPQNPSTSHDGRTNLRGL